MSLLASGVLANPTTPYFGSGGGGGGGVTGLLGTGAGSVPTTASQPTLGGAGGITCTSIAGGVAIAPATVQTYVGPTAEQTLTSGGGDLNFSIPLTTVIGGTYAVSCLVNFKSDTMVTPLTIGAIPVVTINMTNLLSGADLRFVQQTFPIGLFPLATSFPVEFPITLSGVITDTIATNIGVYVSLDVGLPVGQTITVFVSSVTIQRIS